MIVPIALINNIGRETTLWKNFMHWVGEAWSLRCLEAVEVEMSFEQQEV